MIQVHYSIVGEPHAGYPVAFQQQVASPQVAVFVAEMLMILLTIAHPGANYLMAAT